MRQHGFADACSYTQKEGTFFCYRSGAAVYEELLTDGMLYASYQNYAGMVPQVCTLAGQPRLYAEKIPAFALIADGKSICNGLTLTDFSTEQTAYELTARAVFAHRASGLSVTVHTLLDGTGVLQRWLTLQSERPDPLFLQRITVFSGILFGNRPCQDMETRYRLGAMTSGQPCQEGRYHTLLLPPGEYAFGKKATRDHYRSPFFTAEDTLSGGFVLGQLGFSGGFRFRFENAENEDGNPATRKNYLVFHAELGGELSPLLVLATGESFTLPAMHLYMGFAGLDDAVQAMNDHFRGACREYPKTMLCEKALGPDVPMTLQDVLRAADRGKELGAEVFFLDAGWYGDEKSEYHWKQHCGDWLGGDKYPLSIREIRDRVHAIGMKFGLWVRIEELGPDCPAYNDAAVPKMTLTDGSFKLIYSDMRVVDNADPAGLAWTEATICRVIERYGLDFFRIDSHTSPYNAVTSDPSAPFAETDLRYYANFYAMFARLRKKYPEVIFQNCADGGARLDFGMMRQMSNTQYTDQVLAPDTFSVLNGVSMLLPCEYLVQSIVSGGGHIAASLRFMLNIARFSGNHFIGWTLLPPDIAPDEAFTRSVTGWVDTYKTLLRPVFAGSRIFHHTPELTPETEIGILELVSRDQSLGMLGLFALKKPQNPTVQCRFRGLDRAKNYRLLLDDAPFGTATGAELTGNGIPLTLESALDSACLIAVAIDGER